jgi:tripartite motif-containing protein 71
MVRKLMILMLAALIIACGSQGKPAPGATGPQAASAPLFAMKFGTKGEKEGQFTQPFGVAVDGEGNIYVSDLRGVQKFDPRGRFILMFSGEQLGFPRGLAVDRRGKVYVADLANHSVAKFDAQGRFLARFGREGEGDGEFKSPVNLTVDEEGNLYVVDQDDCCIQKLDPNGNFLLRFGQRGQGNGEFMRPRSVALDGEGNIYVTDLGDYLAQKFDPQGNYLSHVGWRHGEESLWLMRGVVVVTSGHAGFGLEGTKSTEERDRLSREGNVYLLDGVNHRIQEFDPQGKLLLEFGQPGRGDGEFQDPEGLAIDRQGNLYVADKGNHRIQKFSPR